MNPLLENSVEALLHEVQGRLVSRPELGVFVLVDGALLQSLPAKVRAAWRSRPAISLLPAGSAHTAQTVGPLLIEVPAGAFGKSWVESLIDGANDEMIGSLLLSSHGAERVADALRNFIDVRLDDDSAMVMRYYDARILPFWLADLSKAYRDFLARSISQWLYWGAHWDTRVLDLTAHSAPPAPNEWLPEFPVRLSAMRETALIDASLPYLLMSRLRQEGHSGLSTMSPSERYSFVWAQIVAARGHGLTGIGDLENFCGLALSLDARFSANPMIAIALQEARSGTPLHEALASLTPQDWQRIRELSR